MEGRVKCRAIERAYGWRYVFGQRPPRPEQQCTCGSLEVCAYCGEQHIVVRKCLVCAYRERDGQMELRGVA
jgi:hypothetical protein